MDELMSLERIQAFEDFGNPYREDLFLINTARAAHALKAENESLREQLSEIDAMAHHLVRDQPTITPIGALVKQADEIARLREQLRTARAEEREPRVTPEMDKKIQDMRAVIKEVDESIEKIRGVVRGEEPQKLRDVINSPSDYAKSWGEP